MRVKPVDMTKAPLQRRLSWKILIVPVTVIPCQVITNTLPVPRGHFVISGFQLCYNVFTCNSPKVRFIVITRKRSRLMKDQSVYVFPSAHFVQNTNSNVYEALNDSNGVSTLVRVVPCLTFAILPTCTFLESNRCWSLLLYQEDAFGRSSESGGTL